tara:strand:- start:43 stop:1968 length:1926 start_codon:yes stop_codon:yes gene_type:complete
MKIRSITIFSLVLLFSTSDSLSAQLFKKTKAAVKKGAEMENARLAINASFYELLQNKQYPVATSLSDAFKSNYSVTELTPYAKKEEKASKRIFKQNLTGMKKSGLAGKLIGGAVAKKADYSIDEVEKEYNARKSGTGYAPLSTYLINDYKITGPIFKDFNAPDEDFNLKSRDDGLSYMEGTEGTRYWDSDIEFGPKMIVTKYKSQKPLWERFTVGKKWKTGGKSDFYSSMRENGIIFMHQLTRKQKKDVESGRNPFNSGWRERNMKYEKNDEMYIYPFEGFAKSTKQEFGYVISNDESNNTNCICSAEYFVNDLDKIIKTANSIDINTLYEKLTDLPSGLPKEELSKYNKHLVFWEIRKLVNQQGYNTTLECKFTIDNNSYELKLSDINRYPFYDGSVTRNGQALYSIKQTLDNEWGDSNYYTPSRSFTVSNNSEDLLAVTSALGFKPPEEKKISGKSAFGGMMKGMKAATKAGFQGKDAGAAMNENNVFGETATLKKALLFNNSMGDNEKLPSFVVGTILSNFKTVYGNETPRNEKFRLFHDYVGGDKYNPYSAELLNQMERLSTAQADDPFAISDYETHIVRKYPLSRMRVKKINNMNYLVNPEFLYWKKHLPSDDVVPVGQDNTVQDCKNCYKDRIYN